MCHYPFNTKGIKILEAGVTSTGTSFKLMCENRSTKVEVGGDTQHGALIAYKIWKQANKHSSSVLQYTMFSQWC